MPKSKKIPVCIHCKLLNVDSYYDVTGTMKSCPRCSQKFGFHAFHPYPSEYGTTDKRSSEDHKEGPQSHCLPCRSKKLERTGTACQNMQIDVNSREVG